MHSTVDPGELLTRSISFQFLFKFSDLKSVHIFDNRVAQNNFFDFSFVVFTTSSTMRFFFIFDVVTVPYIYNIYIYIYIYISIVWLFRIRFA